MIEATGITQIVARSVSSPEWCGSSAAVDALSAFFRVGVRGVGGKWRRSTCEREIEVLDFMHYNNVALVSGINGSG